MSQPDRSELVANPSDKPLLSAIPTAVALGEPFQKVVVGGVSAYGSASTGTRIAGLRGIAAEYATRAWFGLGSRSSGGLGMRFGDKVIGSLRYGPAVILGGATLALEVAVGVRNERTKRSKSAAHEPINFDGLTGRRATRSELSLAEENR